MLVAISRRVNMCVDSSPALSFGFGISLSHTLWAHPVYDLASVPFDLIRLRNFVGYRQHSKYPNLLYTLLGNLFVSDRKPHEDTCLNVPLCDLGVQYYRAGCVLFG
jgi:hypothetical protein